MSMQHAVKGIFFGHTEKFRLLMLLPWLLSGWHEGGCRVSHVCMANLQHHCLWVPELLSLRRMKAVVGAPIPGCQDKSQGCMLSPRALNGCGQGREVAVAYCDSGRARTCHRGI